MLIHFSFTTHYQSQSRSFYNGDAYNMQNNSKFTLELDDSPSHSKEAWPADYVKSEFQSSWIFRTPGSDRRFAETLNTFSAILLGSSAASDSNRKRKGDWMQSHSDFSGQLAENGPIAKISTLNSKDRDRRKSQGKRSLSLRCAKQKDDFYLTIWGKCAN